MRTPLGEECQWRDYKAIATQQGSVANFQNNAQLMGGVNAQAFLNGLIGSQKWHAPRENHRIEYIDLKASVKARFEMIVFVTFSTTASTFFDWVRQHWRKTLCIVYIYADIIITEGLPGKIMCNPLMKYPKVYYHRPLERVI